jgi:hypothetical protein
MTKKHKCEHCDYDCLYQSILTIHLLIHHNIGEKVKCSECDYECNLKENLKVHYSTKHINNVEMLPCPTDDCDYESNTKSGLSQHMTNKHNQNVKWRYCPEDGCDFKCKTSSNLGKHKIDMHTADSDINWNYCDIENCSERYKHKGKLKRHKANSHGIDTVWYTCYFEGCDKQYNTPGSLKNHITGKHDPNAVLYPCEYCGKTFKFKGILKNHLANKHSIGVIWAYCPEDDCNYKSKSKSDIKKHLEGPHDMGDKQCDVCLHNVFSLTKHETGNICRKCYRKMTGRGTRVEKDWSDYTDKHLGTEFLSGTDDNLISLGGCQLYRPDKLYIGIDTVELDECDEHQHSYHSDSYSCDEKRISDIYEEDGICGKTMIVIRWNPGTYKPPDGEKKKNRKERLEMFVKLKKHLRKNPPTDKIHIYYMFYTHDNPLISQNIPATMIYEESDFP